MVFASLSLFRRFDRFAAWLGWARFLRGQEPATMPAGPEAHLPTAYRPTENTWRAWRPGDAIPDGRRPVMDSPQFTIQCIPLEPALALRATVQAECDGQAAAGLKLVSTFTHDGHVFLVFKRP